MDSKRFTRRLVALGAAMFLCALVFVVTLFDAQIVNGDDYLAQSIRTNAKSETVKASRGVITDRNGKVLVSNRAVYTLNFDSSLVSSDELNDALLRVIDLMNAQGVEIKDTLPLARTSPYAYDTANGSAKTPKVHFEQIPIRNLVSNQEYQRNLSQHHVQRAAANFDLYQINPVKVSRRNGINYVFNGQHTIEIVALVSGSRETPVWCMVYDDLGYEHEADIFANQMKYVKPLLPYEIFMANIEAGNDKQLIIRDLVESYDLTIASTTTPGGICAVATLENIHDKYGYHMLDHVIRLIAATWEGASQSFSANMMNGLARFLNAYGDAIKDDVFKEKLGRISIKELARTAKDRRSGSLGFAEAILIYYNKKSRNPLTWDKLYTHKLPHKKDMEEEPSDIPEPGDADGESSQMELFGLHDSGVSG